MSNNIYPIIATVIFVLWIVWACTGFKIPVRVKDEAIVSSPDRDKRMIEQGKCPDCGESTLLSGPSGGMSMNVGCNNCLMEFNVHHHFGGVLGVDRTGKMDEGRARVFGIQADEYREIVAKS